MKTLRVEEAVGQVLCHDLTRIVQGEMKGPQFRKGHIIVREDIPMLLSMGKEHVYVWEKQPGMLHEDEAAGRLAALCLNDHIRGTNPVEGKIELFAVRDGLFRIDTDRLRRINSLENILIAARHSLTAVKAGDKLAAVKVVPLVIPEEKLAEAEALGGGRPVMELLPYTLTSACVITTGSEVAQGRIKDTFTPVIVEKLAACGITVKRHIVTEDGTDRVAAAIDEALKEQSDMILCTGGMSVDPDDNTPGAIKQSGAEIVSYGAPVFPGAMFLLGYYPGGRVIMGLPGCVMYAGATVFDIVLPRIAAGIRMGKEDFAAMGNGGLCLSCKACIYPACPFGKTP
jgi:molybdenum cofactor synthesis domain-containing protein